MCQRFVEIQCVVLGKEAATSVFLLKADEYFANIRTCVMDVCGWPSIAALTSGCVYIHRHQHHHKAEANPHGDVFEFKYDLKQLSFCFGLPRCFSVPIIF